MIMICCRYNFFLICLSQLANCRSQFLLDRPGRCLTLFVSTDGPSSHEFPSQFGQAWSTGLILSVILSSTIANKQGRKTDHWCSPTFTSNPPPSLLPHTSPLLYCHHRYIVLLSHTSLPIQALSCNITPLLLAPCHKLSPGPQTHNVAPSDLLSIILLHQHNTIA